MSIVDDEIEAVESRGKVFRKLYAPKVGTGCWLGEWTVGFLKIRITFGEREEAWILPLGFFEVFPFFSREFHFGVGGKAGVVDVDVAAVRVGRVREVDVELLRA